MKFTPAQIATLIVRNFILNRAKDKASSLDNGPWAIEVYNRGGVPGYRVMRTVDFKTSCWVETRDLETAFKEISEKNLTEAGW
jgi:hypothetical protein